MKNKFLRELIKHSIYILFLPIVLFTISIRPFKFIKFCELSIEGFAVCLTDIEGYLRAKKFSDTFKKNLIIFYYYSKSSSDQLKIMIEREIQVSSNRVFFKILSNTFLFWGIKSHILSLNATNMFNCVDFQKSRTVLSFTDEERKRGKELLNNLGIKSGDKWICIHNRDEKYREKMLPNRWPSIYRSWSYHSYRNFSISYMKSAAEFLASKGYFVLRMGKIVDEKLYSDNEKIIDYANSKLRNDFFDMHLLANCEAYFGSESGIHSVPFVFKKPFYLINTTTTNIFSMTTYNNRIITFKRIRNIKTGELLSMKDILQSSFAYCLDSEEFKNNNVELVSNTSEEIKSFAVEMYSQLNGNTIDDEKEDAKLQKKFWDIYYKFVDNKKIGSIKPQISSSFLRSNLDLLN